MVCYGYLRVSTDKQIESNFKASILNLANELNLGRVNWISETISGRKDWRNRELGKKFKEMVENDTIVMAEFSRISRNFLEGMEFLSECRRKKIKVYSCAGDIPETDDSTSNLLLSITAWKSQVEVENIAYRTRIGLQAAKQRGVQLGRKRKMILDNDPMNKVNIKEAIDRGVKLIFIAKEYKCTPKTLYTFIKKHNLKDKNIKYEGATISPQNL